MSVLIVTSPDPLVKPDILNPEDTRPSPEEEMIMTAVGEKLFAEYPGYYWYVEVTQGMCYIKCFSATGSTPDYPDPFKFGFKKRLIELQEDPTLRSVITMGGELLERAGLRRGRAKE